MLPPLCLLAVKLYITALSPIDYLFIDYLFIILFSYFFNIHDIRSCDTVYTIFQECKFLYAQLSHSNKLARNLFRFENRLKLQWLTHMLTFECILVPL